MTGREQRGITKRSQRGMTLVELIVAVTILGLLSTLAVPWRPTKSSATKNATCVTRCVRFVAPSIGTRMLPISKRSK